VLLEIGADWTTCFMKFGGDCLEIGKDALQVGLIDTLIRFEARQNRGTALEFLQYFSLQVRAPENAQYIQHSSQGAAAIPLTRLVQMVSSLGEQELEAQKRPYALVQWLFINNRLVHRDAASCLERAIVQQEPGGRNVD